MAGQQECEQESQHDHGDPDRSSMELHVKLVAQGSNEYRKLIHRWCSLAPFNEMRVCLCCSVAEICHRLIMHLSQFCRRGGILLAFSWPVSQQRYVCKLDCGTATEGR